jgi:TPR repeat protein
VSVQEPVTAEDQFRLGKQYATRDGVLKDEAEAVKWLRRVADQGLTEAANMLAGLSAEVRPSDAITLVKTALYDRPVGVRSRWP